MRVPFRTALRMHVDTHTHDSRGSHIASIQHVLPTIADINMYTACAVCEWMLPWEVSSCAVCHVPCVVRRVPCTV